MKKFIRKILAGDIPIREYATITINNDIQEQVYLSLKDHMVNVSGNQWVFCLEPLIFGVWIEDEKLKTELNEIKKCSLVFEDSNSVKNKVAIAAVDLVHTIKEDAGTLFLLELKKSRLYHLGFIRTHVLFQRYYKKPNLTFKKFKSFVTAYSYPRKVRIISFRSEDHYNIFPMDLVGELRKNNRMIFGLRHTNRTLSRIIETKKITASEVPYTSKAAIYSLGSHHSTTPPLPQELPFTIFESTSFGFYIPEWAESYKEVRILKTINLGSHMLLWGELVNETILKPLTTSLYHIHFLHYLHQKEKGIEYPLI